MIRFLRFVFGFYLGLAVLLSLIWLGLWQNQGMKLYNLQTNSMVPVMQPGDLVITAKTAPKDLKVGQIISYKNLQNPQTVITHRIYKIYPKQGYVVTKGDGLAQPDPPVSYGDINGKTVKIVPKLGYGFSFLHQPLGLALIVYLPAMLICSYELQRILSLYSYQTYSATRRL